MKEGPAGSSDNIRAEDLANTWAGSLTVHFSRSILVVVATVVLLAVGMGVWYGTRVQRADSRAEEYQAPGDAAVSAGSETGSQYSAVDGALKADPAARLEHGSFESNASFKNRFRNAGNYRTFLTEALPAAQAGNADAQYYVSAALAFCDETWRFFFKRKDRILSVDEAIAERNSTRDWSLIRGIRRADDRCHDVTSEPEPSWGSADQWLAKATESGQSLAQTVTALKIALQVSAPGLSIIKKTGESNSGETYSLDDARALASAAIASKNPEVIFHLSDFVGSLHPDLPDEELVQEAFAWKYAACLRGLDCSAESEWHTNMCVGDPGCLPQESGTDYLRRLASLLNMADLEQRAKSVNEMIDAGDWDALGLVTASSRRDDRAATP